MTRFARRALGRLVDMRGGETRSALLLFAYSFLAMTAYNILKPVTRSTFITGFGADNLPYVQLAAGVLIGVLMHAYSQAARSLPPRLVVPVTQAGLVLLILIFWILFATGAAWVPAAFYVLGLILGILLISQFWTVANDIFDARQAKRLFGFIGGGASLGGALGAGITATAVQAVGTHNLLPLSAAILAAAVALLAIIFKAHAAAGEPAAPDARRGAEGGESIRPLLDSTHVRVVALLIGCAALGATIIEQQLNMAAESIGGAAATDLITGFLAEVTFYLSAIGFVVQVSLTSRIHRSAGLGFALLLLPIGLGSSAIVILVTGAVWAPAVARVLDGTLRYTIDKTSRELLYLPLPPGLKYRAKPFIDVTVERVAKAVGALLVLVLIKPWGLGLDWRQLSYASLAVMGIWMLLALVARREYLKAFRAGIGARALAPDIVRVNGADAATIEALVEELSSADDRSVSYAIAMLEALDKRNLVTPLLLHHESAAVRARALIALGSTRAAGTSRWTAMVNRMLTDEDVGVRAAAMRALTVLHPEDAVGLMRRYLADMEPRVAVTAAVTLAESGADADVDAAFERLQQLVADPRAPATAGRLEVARALAHIRHPRFRALLVPLLHDGEIEVAREAIRSTREAGAVYGLFVPALLSLLGHRALKRAARDALVSHGRDIVEVLGYVLRDRDEHAWVRRHVPATLALVPSQRSMDMLTEALGDPDGFLRFKALEAIERLHRERPALVFAPETIEKFLLKETARYYDYFTLRHNLLLHPAGAQSLLARALDDNLERLLDRVYRMLGLLYPGRGIDEARHAIARGDRRRRAAALEYLDTLLGGAVRRRVMPILEPGPIEQKVRHANLVLKTRPRDIDETVAQLVHEDDPVVSAAAIRFVEQQRLWSLWHDLDHVLARRPPQDRYVLEAALSARHARGAAASTVATEAEPSIVALADRLRASPLGEHVSIDELFRLAEAGQHVRYRAGRDLCQQGARAEDVWFLLEGCVRLARAGGASQQLDAPAFLGLDDVLPGQPVMQTITALDRVVCLRIGAADVLTMLSDNAGLAQGVFRMLLSMSRGSWPAVFMSLDAPALVARALPLQPIDKVLLLRQHPLFARATPLQLFDLVGIAREVALTAGDALFAEEDEAAIYLVLQGEVQLDGGETGPMSAPAGATMCVAETLAGRACGRRATVGRDGYALRLDRDELFGVLADRVDLLQGLFSGLLALPAAEADVAAGL